MSKTKKAIITLILLTFFFGLGIQVVQAHDDITLEVPLGSYSKVKYPYFTDYLKNVFEYFVAITAILAAVGLMWGGFKWVAASGNQKVIGSAKETIFNAAIGIIIALTAYLLLFTLNPRITELDFPGVPSPEGNLGQQISCSGSNIQLFDPLTGTCYKNADQSFSGPSGTDPFEVSDCLPCNTICHDLETTPDTVVYGTCRFCSNVYAGECGEQTAGNPCDTNGCGCIGTHTGDVHKGCFVLSREGTTNAYFSVMELIDIPGSASKGFDILGWKGDDGAFDPRETTEPSYKEFRCGEIYYEKGLTDYDGHYGTWCPNSSGSRGKDKCVIDYASGVTWNGRNKEDCDELWLKSGMKVKYCLVGRFNNYWCPDGEDGLNCSPGQTDGCGNGGGGGGAG